MWTNRIEGPPYIFTGSGKSDGAHQQRVLCRARGAAFP
jgi:hypothetical protein